MKKFDAMASAKVFSGKPEQTEINLGLIKYPALVSIKYDGWRMFDVGGEVRCRSLKPPKNTFTQRMMKELYSATRGYGLIGLDGEAIRGPIMDMNAMQNSSSMFNSYDVEDDFTYLVFDAYGNADQPFERRLAHVQETVERLRSNFPWVQFVDHLPIHDRDALLAHLSEIEALGGEGVMGRSYDGPYKFGRSTMKEGFLWALKPYADDEAEIIGFADELENQNEQTIDERGYSKRSGHQDNLVPKGRLGKFICRSPKFPETFSIGAGIGLTHELRQRVWDNQHLYLGRHITYKYQAVGVKERPRQPKFMGFRAEEDMALMTEDRS